MLFAVFGGGVVDQNFLDHPYALILVRLTIVYFFLYIGNDGEGVGLIHSQPKTPSTIEQINKNTSKKIDLLICQISWLHSCC